MARLLPWRQPAHDHRAGIVPVLLLCVIGSCILLAVFVGVLGHCRCQACEQRANFEFGPEHSLHSRYPSWRVTYGTAKRHNNQPGNSSLHNSLWVACPEEGEEGYSPRNHDTRQPLLDSRDAAGCTRGQHVARPSSPVDSLRLQEYLAQPGNRATETAAAAAAAVFAATMPMLQAGEPTYSNSASPQQSAVHSSDLTGSPHSPTDSEHETSPAAHTTQGVVPPLTAEELGQLKSRLPGPDGARSRPMNRSAAPQLVHESCREAITKMLLELLVNKCQNNLSHDAVKAILMSEATNLDHTEEYQESVPLTYDAAMATLAALQGEWPEINQYDACPTCNDLFRCDRKDDKECSKCKELYPDNPEKYSRFTDDECKQSACVFHCFSLCQWLRLLLSNKVIAATMTNYSTTHWPDIGSARETMTDIFDGNICTRLKSQYPDFFATSTNILLGLTTDGFSVTGKREELDRDDPRERKQSIWPFTATIFNLPACIRTKMGACAPLGITPLNHFHDVTKFLEVFVDELAWCWHGLEVPNYGGVPNCTKVVRVMLVQLIADYPALGKLLDRKLQPTPKACYFCHVQGVLAWAGKTFYDAYYRWFPMNDARRAVAAVLNVTSLNSNATPNSTLGPSAPQPASRTSEELTPPTNASTSSSPQPLPEGYNCPFNKLPYWDPMLMATYDGMHCIGDCVKLLFSALVSISTNVANYEQQTNGRWLGVSPSCFPFILTLEHQQIAETRLREVERSLPRDIRKCNISTCFSKPSRLKTHDWFILASPIGKYALAGLLPAAQEKALFLFFDVCSLMWRKVISRPDLNPLGLQVLEALHQVQMAFPCSVATIVMHNMTHLVNKIKLVGPLYLTSMFPYERSYRLLRSWITNQAHVEASLAKNIRANNMQVLYTANATTVVASSIFDVNILNEEADTVGTLSSYVSPYEQQSNGDWKVESSSGRLRNKAQTLSAVNVNSNEYPLLHLYHYEANSTYRDLFMRFLDTLSEADRPPQQGGQYKPHQWDVLKLRAALESWRNEWSIDGTAADGVPLTEEERAMAAGPPTTYYMQSDVTIGGQRFTASRGDISDAASIRDSVFLRGTHETNGRLFFGVLREVRVFQPIGIQPSHSSHREVMASHNQVVLVVDWIAHAHCDQPKLHVPVVKAEIMAVGSGTAVARYFPGQHFCSPHDVIPTSIVLAPAYASANDGHLLSKRYFVLHRDPKLSELSSFGNVHSIR